MCPQLCSSHLKYEVLDGEKEQGKPLPQAAAPSCSLSAPVCMFEWVLCVCAHLYVYACMCLCMCAYMNVYVREIM